MITLIIIVAASMVRNPSNTDTSFPFVASFASALAGNTIRSPIHTMIPTEIKNVISSNRVTTFSIIDKKSHPVARTPSFNSAPCCMTPVGLQLLKPLSGFSRLN